MNDEQMWKAVQARDASQDGRFFYGVTTTGVYCRPSCSTPRQALRRNMRFFATPEAAARAGLRPCKRCRPLELSANAMTAKVQALCRYIEQHAAVSIGKGGLSLEALSRHAHLSPFHLQRSFKAVAGVTPRQYLEACRLRHFKRGLRKGEPRSAPVTRAIYDAGFGSASRVYERVATRLGMTPKQYRAGGKGVAISYATAQTPLGLLMMGATDRGLCFVQFGDSEAELVAQLQAEYPGATLAAMGGAMRSEFGAWMHALAAQLEGAQQQLELPLDVRGTAFQMRVWSYLQKIPSGEVRSYGEVARAIGMPKAVRAVAGACAANRVAVLIPCHRVIRGDGALGGYRWGLERKRNLLDQERRRRAGTNR